MINIHPAKAILSKTFIQNKEISVILFFKTLRTMFFYSFFTTVECIRSFLYTGVQWSTPKIKFLCIWKTRLDLECSSPAFNKYIICKNFTQQGQNLLIISCSGFLPLAFFQQSYFWNSELEHSRSDLVFKQPSLHNNFIL